MGVALAGRDVACDAVLMLLERGRGSSAEALIARVPTKRVDRLR